MAPARARVNRESKKLDDIIFYTHEQKQDIYSINTFAQRLMQIPDATIRASTYT